MKSPATLDFLISPATLDFLIIPATLDFFISNKQSSYNKVVESKDLIDTK